LAERPLWAVVKCDGYRMGMVPVARACLDAGAERLCVVEIREAEALRAAGVRAPIVHVAATPAEDLESALRHDVIVSVADVDRAQTISALAERLGVTAKVHIAIETGTGWWGVTPANAHAFAARVAQLPNIEWEGAWTHIAGRDSMDAQLHKLHAGVAALREHGAAVPVLHVGSTGPTVWNLREGAARIGVGLYGASMGDATQGTRLRTALEVRAPVYAIRRYSEPMPLGYGGTYVALPGQTIVTLRIGYGEGMPKALSGRGCVVLSGVQCQIVGAIGMNFTMVAVPPNVTLSATDEALIVGDVAGVKLEEVAVAAQTIPHNIMTMFGAGIPPLHVTSDGAARQATAGARVQERG
jgi:alanine racemase